MWGSGVRPSNKGKKIIVVKSSSFTKFLELVDPFIIPELRYKLPGYVNNTSVR